jgi:hypothetical protein
MSRSQGKRPKPKVSETLHFTFGRDVAIDRLIVEVVDDDKRFAWRLSVNGDWSPWYDFYPGILMHKGYGLATDYYDLAIKGFTPFRIEYATAQ